MNNQNRKTSHLTNLPLHYTNNQLKKMKLLLFFLAQGWKLIFNSAQLGYIFSLKQFYYKI